MLFIFYIWAALIERKYFVWKGCFALMDGDGITYGTIYFFEEGEIEAIDHLILLKI